MNATLRKIGGYIAATIALVIVWSAASIALKSPALPMPQEAFTQFLLTLPAMLPEAGVSLYRVIVAMAIGCLLALPIGLWVGRSRRADAVVAPLLYLLYPIPKVVFLPVLMVLLGIEDMSKIVLIAIVIFFQTLVTSRDAAKLIPEPSITSVRSLGASPLQIARHVIVPASLPDVFTALRINTGTAIAILFLAESIAGSSGLGYFILDSWGRVDYPSMFAGIIGMAIMGVFLYELLNAIEWRLTRWLPKK